MKEFNITGPFISIVYQEVNIDAMLVTLKNQVITEVERAMLLTGIMGRGAR